MPPVLVKPQAEVREENGEITVTYEYVLAPMLPVSPCVIMVSQADDENQPAAR